MSFPPRVLRLSLLVAPFFFFIHGAVTFHANGHFFPVHHCKLLLMEIGWKLRLRFNRHLNSHVSQFIHFTGHLKDNNTCPQHFDWHFHCFQCPTPLNLQLFSALSLELTPTPLWLHSNWHFNATVYVCIWSATSTTILTLANVSSMNFQQRAHLPSP